MTFGRVCRVLAFGSLSAMGGFVSGVGVTLAFGIPWVPVAPYVLHIAGVFMMVVGLFTILASGGGLPRRRDMDGREALTRLAQQARARLEVTEAEMDRLGVAIDMAPTGGRESDLRAYRILLSRFDALTEVLGIVETERRGL